MSWLGIVLIETKGHNV